MVVEQEVAVRASIKSRVVFVFGEFCECGGRDGVLRDAKPVLATFNSYLILVRVQP